MAKKKAAKAALPAKTAAPKKHERTIKPTEAERLEKGRRLACAYLEQSQGLDPQVALDVVESMTPDEVMAVIVEANTATMERQPLDSRAHMGDGAGALAEAAPDAPVTSPSDAPEAEEIAVDFMTIPQLASHETFSGQVVECIEANTLKKNSEKKYKALKKVLIGIMRPINALHVEVFGSRLDVYKGKSKTLSISKLLEKGVDIDTINECYVETEYDDVRITVPGEPKEAK